MPTLNNSHRTRPALKPLEATYQARAVPPGTARYWSWLFAAPEMQPSLLGIYALGAEWLALMDPATASDVARLKLAWWQEEMQRLSAGSAVHPISTYIAALPRAPAVDFSALLAAIGAAAAQVNGAPLQHSADLEPQAEALWGAPLALASRLGAAVTDEVSLRHCTAALAAAEYLARAIRDYRREARVGRVPFAVADLLAAGIDNDDLAAQAPPEHLRRYLDTLRDAAAQYFSAAARALPREQRGPQRHLLVLAALGRAHLHGHGSPPRRRLRDLWLAWSTARRAH
jgi:15-cis-phytoene synthase